MKRLEILPGHRFGRLTVINEHLPMNPKSRKFLLKCDCGNTTNALLSNLNSNKIRSCGCLHSEVSSKLYSKMNFSHGLSQTKFYHVWQCMIDRCHNPKSQRYDRYGGRGISVCNSWRKSFLNFRKDMLGGYEEGLAIDRINNDGNYEPNNCRWVTNKVNVRNSSLTKINPDTVKKIKELLQTKKFTQKIIAKMTGTSAGIVQSISSGNSWADIN